MFRIIVERVSPLRAFLALSLGLILSLTLANVPLYSQTSGTGTTGTGTSAAFTALQTAMAPLTGQSTNNVLVFNFSRSDIQPVIAGASGVKPELVYAGTLSFWANPSGTTAPGGTPGNSVIMTAEIPLLTTEVQAVVKSVDSAELHIIISAIHNHVLESTPPSVFLHLEASGDATQLATAVKGALKLTGNNLSPTTPTTTLAGLDTAGVNSALGATGTADNGIYDVEIPRNETITECAPVAASFATSSGTGTSGTNGGYSPESKALGTCAATPYAASGTASGGVTVPAELGALSEVRIQPNGTSSVVAIDLALLPAEIDPTIHSLEMAGNFQFSAVHNHFVVMAPQLFFLHVAAVGDPVAISKQIRTAISANRTAAGQQP